MPYGQIYNPGNMGTILGMRRNPAEHINKLLGPGSLLAEHREEMLKEAESMNQLVGNLVNASQGNRELKLKEAAEKADAAYRAESLQINKEEAAENRKDRNDLKTERQNDKQGTLKAQLEILGYTPEDTIDTEVNDKKLLNIAASLNSMPSDVQIKPLKTLFPKFKTNAELSADRIQNKVDTLEQGRYNPLRVDSKKEKIARNEATFYNNFVNSAGTATAGKDTVLAMPLKDRVNLGITTIEKALKPADQRITEMVAKLTEGKTEAEKQYIAPLLAQQASAIRLQEAELIKKKEAEKEFDRRETRKTSDKIFVNQQTRKKDTSNTISEKDYLIAKNMIDSLWSWEDDDTPELMKAAATVKAYETMNNISK